MRRIVIGADPSSKKLAFFMVLPNGKAVRSVVKTLPDPSPPEVKADWAERHTRVLVSYYVKREYEVFIFVEDPALGRGGAHATILQATVRGGILIGARRAGATEIHGANNSRWKKVVLGKGNFPKAKIPRELRRLWPVAYEMTDRDPDACDAACVAYYGVKVLELEKRIKDNKEQ